ncbi:MAG: T9SS type A sorting domain-containing protein, partial [Bacteroidota bacterium]
RVMNDANYQQFSWVFNKRPVQFMFDPSDNIVLKQGTTTVGIIDEQIIKGYFRLFQNHPNPAQNQTRITYELVNPSVITLEVIDILGKVVKSYVYSARPAGMNSVDLDCSALPSGVYYYRVKAGDVMQTKKMFITK